MQPNHHNNNRAAGPAAAASCLDRILFASTDGRAKTDAEREAERDLEATDYARRVAPLLPKPNNNNNNTPRPRRNRGAPQAGAGMIVASPMAQRLGMPHSPLRVPADRTEELMVLGLLCALRDDGATRFWEQNREQFLLSPILGSPPWDKLAQYGLNVSAFLRDTTWPVQSLLKLRDDAFCMRAVAFAMERLEPVEEAWGRPPTGHIRTRLHPLVVNLAARGRIREAFPLHLELMVLMHGRVHATLPPVRRGSLVDGSTRALCWIGLFLQRVAAEAPMAHLRLRVLEEAPRRSEWLGMLSRAIGLLEAIEDPFERSLIEADVVQPMRAIMQTHGGYRDFAGLSPPLDGIDTLIETVRGRARVIVGLHYDQHAYLPPGYDLRRAAVAPPPPPALQPEQLGDAVRMMRLIDEDVASSARIDAQLMQVFTTRPEDDVQGELLRRALQLPYSLELQAALLPCVIGDDTLECFLCFEPIGPMDTDARFVACCAGGSIACAACVHATDHEALFKHPLRTEARYVEIVLALRRPRPSSTTTKTTTTEEDIDLLARLNVAGRLEVQRALTPGIARDYLADAPFLCAGCREPLVASEGSWPADTVCLACCGSESPAFLCGACHLQWRAPSSSRRSRRQRHPHPCVFEHQAARLVGMLRRAFRLP